jgi:hypothetical protein
MRRIGRAQDSRSAAPEKPEARVHLALDPTLAIVILQVELPTSAAVETAKEPKRASKQRMCRTLLKSGDGPDGTYALSRTPTSSA